MVLFSLIDFSKPTDCFFQTPTIPKRIKYSNPKGAAQIDLLSSRIEISETTNKELIKDKKGSNTCKLVEILLLTHI